MEWDGAVQEPLGDDGTVVAARRDWTAQVDAWLRQALEQRQGLLGGQVTRAA